MTSWERVCLVQDLTPDRGSVALVGDQQVAVFRLSDSEDIHAIDQRDPFSRANVMARGLVGSRAGVPTVASPMHKQSFDLRSGQCLDDADAALAVWPTRIVDGWLEVSTGEP